MKDYRKNRTAILVFSVPVLLIFSVFVIFPIFQVAYRSLFEWDGVTEGKFIFLNNYFKVFKDEIFYVSFKNGLIFAGVLIVYQIVIASVLALTMTNKSLPGRNLLRKSYFIPVVLSVTVTSQLWLSMYNPNYGLFNKIFEVLGLNYSQDWLSSMGISSIIAVAMTEAWHGMGYQFLLIYMGAKSIPIHYMEAARIDGATNLQTHMKVTIPLLSETYRICLMFTAIGGLNAFAQMQIMTKGGPGNATYSLTYFMYRSAFSLQQYGYGCTIAVVLLLQCLFVTLLINKFVARERISF